MYKISFFKSQYAKLLLAFFLTVFSSHIIYAYDLYIDGIYYNINDDLTSVTVTSGDNKYLGDVVIPSTIKVGSTKTLDVTAIGNNAFDNCSSLTSISIYEGVTSIGYAAFYKCFSLTSIFLPESVTSIESNAFYGCSSLTDAKYASVESICRISYGNSYSHPCYYADNLYIDGELVTSIEIPESVTSIGDYTFSHCTSLTSISIPESVTSIGDEAFRDCSSLTSISLPKSMTSIGSNAFKNCSSLTSISLPESVTSIGSSAFNFCSSLKDAKFASVESMCRISYGSYESNPCYYADNLYIDGELVTSIEIPESVTSIGDYTFSHCTSLTSISIPESLTSIGSNAFYNCSSLTSISIPEGVTSIGDGVFYICSSLTSISIPESVTSIGNNAFRGCSSLTSISIPESVTSIGYYAFRGCSSLTSVICYAENAPSIYSDTFLDTPLLSALYVPASAVEAYKATDYWKDIENIFAIEDGIKLSVGEAGLATYCPTNVNLDLSEAKDIAAYRATVEDNTVILTRTYKIGVGEGVLLRSLNGGETTETVNIAKGKIEDEPNDFVGVLKEQWLFETDDNGNTNFLLSRQKDGSIGFYKAKDLTKLAAGKAYLPVPSYNPSEASAKALRLVFDDDNATGIDIAEAKQAEADGAYYTLSGVKVETPTAKGIYIKNGKKYIIK